MHVQSGPDPAATRFLDLDESKVFHQKMTLPVTIGDNADMDRICGHKIMLGQPVKLSDAGFTVLRIALGADMVVRALAAGSREAQQEVLDALNAEDEVVVNKLGLLAKHWSSVLKGEAAAAPARGDADLLARMRHLEQQVPAAAGGVQGQGQGQSAEGGATTAAAVFTAFQHLLSQDDGAPPGSC